MAPNSNCANLQHFKMAYNMVEDPDIYYKTMEQYVLSEHSLYEIGFPVKSYYNKFQINPTNYFGDSSIARQRCRCKKTISLLDKKWYYATDCRYHPLKADKKNAWRYKCCGSEFNSPGCVSSNFHTCSYIFLHGDWFIIRKDWGWKNACNIFALDCEFVFTEIGMEVARVSLVSLYEGVVYDTFVKPKYKILDYNTQFSGVVPQDLHYAKSLYRVQSDLVYKFLNVNSILIGHGLHSDLKGLHICHENVIDTSILYPHYKGFPYRYSLEYLAQEYLGISIHDSASGHDSIEDAVICLRLVALKCGFSDLQYIIDRF